MTEGEDPRGSPRAPAPAVLDPAVLSELVSAFGGPAVALRFVSGYLELAPTRTARVRAGLEQRRRDDAEVALLSLRGSSEMLGARRVGHRCTAVLHLVHTEEWGRARAVLPELVADVGDADRALRRWSAHQGGVSGGPPPDDSRPPGRSR